MQDKIRLSTYKNHKGTYVQEVWPESAGTDYIKQELYDRLEAQLANSTISSSRGESVPDTVEGWKHHAYLMADLAESMRDEMNKLKQENNKLKQKNNKLLKIGE